MALVDLTGKRFDRLLVERIDETSGKVKFWHCICDCGSARRVFGGDLKRGNTRSCGCLMREQKAERLKTHGMARHPAYRSWICIKGRCENPQDDNYALYGGRGITICSDWQSFEVFWADMGATWADGLSVDRIDSNGNYEPTNCRWATPKEQANNRRNNHIINTPDGPMNVSEAAERFGITKQSIFGRLRAGWPEDKLLLPPQFNMRWHS